MSARKAKPERPYEEYKNAIVPPRPRKKSRSPRARLTHLEVRRGGALRLRIAITDDALAEIGDELGALIKRIAPNTKTTVVAVPEEPAAIIVEQEHVEHDAAYHAGLREHLVQFFGSVCDTTLQDALDIARQERDRRAEGGN